MRSIIKNRLSNLIVLLLIGFAVICSDKIIVNATEAGADYYKVTYYSNEGYINGDVNTKESTFNVPIGESLNGNYPYVGNYAGHVLVGWKIKGEDGTIYPTPNYLNSYNSTDIHNYKPDSPVTFEAVWEDAYDITFYSEEGYIFGQADVKEAKIQVAKGCKLNNYASVSGYAGYALVGWKVKDGDGTIYTLDDPYEDTYLYNYEPEASMTFEAVWGKAYDITFRSEVGYIYGQADNKEVTVQVVEGHKINYAIGASGYAGHTLAGWKIDGEDDTLYTNVQYYQNTDENRKFIGNYEPTSSITFEAVWEESYDVTFHSEKGYIFGQADNKEVTIQVAQGNKIDISYSIGGCPGHVFAGWKINGEDSTLYTNVRYYQNTDEKYIGDYEPTSSVTFEAVWEEAFDVTFYSYEGYIFGDSGRKEITYQIKKGDKINNYTEPYGYQGHIFAGWKIKDGDGTLYTDPDYDDSNNYITDYKPESSMTFVAVWEDALTVTFVYDNGEDVEEVPYMYEEGAHIDGSPHRVYSSGMALAGWKLSGDNSGTIYTNFWNDLNEIENAKRLSDYVVTDNVTFEAYWLPAVKVSFDPNGGYIDDGDNEINVIKGKYLEYTTYVEGDEKVFAGWKIDGDTSGKIYYDEINYYGDKADSIYNYMFNEDTTLVAQWIEAVDVTFKSDYGYAYRDYFEEDDGFSYTRHYAKGYAINDYNEIDIPGRNGYDFVGWKTAGDNTVYSNDPEADNSIYDYIVKNDVIFEAVWKQSTGSEDGTKQDGTKQDGTKQDGTKQDGEQQGGTKQDSTKQDGTKQDGTKQDEAKQDSATQTAQQSSTPDSQTSNNTTTGYAVGKEATEGSVKYLVDTEDEVTYVANTYSASTTIVIPDTVSLNGKEYKVTKIAAKAFAKNNKLKKVIIGKNVTTIAKNAFNGDKKLKTVTIKSTKIKSIGKNAFKNINKKAVINIPKSLKKSQLAKYKKMIKKAGISKTVKIKKK